MTGFNKLTKADYTKTTLRAYFLQNGFNYTNYQGLGYALVMYPAFKKMYGDDQARLAKELENNSEFYNTNPNFLPFVTSIHLAMADKGYDYESIRGIKMALMGPLAGIGDSFFWGTIRIIAAGVGISLAQQGSPIAPLVFLLLFNIPHILVRYFGCKFGYAFGTNLLSNLNSNGIIQTISKGATIVGLMVIGAMSASMVSMSSSIIFKIGETDFALQKYLDQIFPLLLPLCYTLFMLWLLKKGLKSSHILFITIIVGILGHMVGFF